MRKYIYKFNVYIIHTHFFDKERIKEVKRMANKIVPQTLNSSGVYDKLITAISSGGTGAESESAAVKNLISGLTSTSPASDDLIPFQDVSSGGAGKTTLSALASALQSVRGYAKIQTGSYVGTGTYGASNPCSLTFTFEPKMLIVANKSIISFLQSIVQWCRVSSSSYHFLAGIFWFDGFDKISNSGDSQSDYENFYVIVTKNNQSISWYSNPQSTGTVDEIHYQISQQNYKNATYNYIRMG